MLYTLIKYATISPSGSLNSSNNLNGCTRQKLSKMSNHHSSKTIKVHILQLLQTWIVWQDPLFFFQNFFNYLNFEQAFRLYLLSFNVQKRSLIVQHSKATFRYVRIIFNIWVFQSVYVLQSDNGNEKLSAGRNSENFFKKMLFCSVSRQFFTLRFWNGLKVHMISKRSIYLL